MRIKEFVYTGVLAFSALATAMAGGKDWKTDFEAAKKQAADEKKDLLLDFTGSDWCGWCIKLNKEVFDLAPFKAGTKDSFVLVELDFPQEKELPAALKEQNGKLQEAFAVEGFPSIYLCDASGRPYAVTGYKEGGAEAYVKHLNILKDVRAKRDAAFAAADKASDDKDKAKHLVEGLKVIDAGLVDTQYKDVIEKITELDKEDSTGFIKERKLAIAKKAAEDKVQELVV